MSVKATITDGNGDGLRATVAQPLSYLPPAIVAYTRPFTQYDFTTRFFVNETFGADMNQNVSFGGTPEGIHNGTDTVEWTSSALSGTWNFASTAQAHTGTKSVDATATTNNNQALFTAPASISMSDYEAMTGWVYIAGWDTRGTKEVRLQNRLSGTNDGSLLDLSTYIDTTLFNTWQKFTIPKIDFLLTVQDIDELVVTTIDTGAGAPPNYYLDDMQWEETGAPLEYVYAPPQGEVHTLLDLVYFFADGLTGNYPNNVSYDKILNVPTLTNGISIRFERAGVVLFSSVTRQISDYLQFPAVTLRGGGSDGTNTWMQIHTELENGAVAVDGRRGDRIVITINDDLSGLLKFRATIRAKVEQVA